MRYYNRVINELHNKRMYRFYNSDTITYTAVYSHNLNCYFIVKQSHVSNCFVFAVFSDYDSFFTNFSAIASSIYWLDIPSSFPFDTKD